ncbi:MAG: precorrin-6y C5,15-methyltransferase (decarboxylating) subunit CbiE [Oscillospiraceae bacterium]|nr:precorrin-6y C5,15-methyltransferase (decarboxylating) subunit CbiE [Oscillospiraceae bacterium]
MRTFYIIGAGPGSAQCLTREAEDAIARCGAVIATARIARELGTLRADIEVAAYSDTAARAISSNGDVAVLVSGDTGFFSAARTLIPQLSEHGEVRVLTGVGSLQYFCAKLQTRWDDAELISLHGRDTPILGAVSYCPKVLALTGGHQNGAGEVCSRLTDAGLGFVSVRIGENLSMDGERIICGTAAELAGIATAEMSVMLLENPAFVSPDMPLRDADFARGDAPMTKEEVRWLAAAKLRISRGDTVLDIGAGTGSCSMEFARRACRGRVIAVERDAEALRLLAENREKTGAYNVEIVAANAPDGLDELPTPDRVFVGGSGGRLRDILAPLFARNPKLRVVVTAITLETLHEAVTTLEDLGLTVEVTQVSAARTRQVGGYRMLTGMNPVFIISGGGE